MSIKKITSGTTRRVTWINSGATASPIYTHLLTGSETSVSSVSMTSSGNGHYYSDITLPGSAAFFVVETNATISGKIYKKKEKVQTVIDGVD